MILNEKYVSESVNMKYNDNYNTLKNNQYYLDNYGIRCAFKLHKNNDTALANFPYVKTKEYSNEIKKVEYFSCNTSAMGRYAGSS